MFSLSNTLRFVGSTLRFFRSTSGFVSSMSRTLGRLREYAHIWHGVISLYYLHLFRLAFFLHTAQLPYDCSKVKLIFTILFETIVRIDWHSGFFDTRGLVTDTCPV